MVRKWFISVAKKMLTVCMKVSVHGFVRLSYCRRSYLVTRNIFLQRYRRPGPVSWLLVGRMRHHHRQTQKCDARTRRSLGTEPVIGTRLKCIVLLSLRSVQPSHYTLKGATIAAYYSFRDSRALSSGMWHCCLVIPLTKWRLCSSCSKICIHAHYKGKNFLSDTRPSEDNSRSV